MLTFRKSLPGEWHPNGRSYVLVDPYEARVVQTIDARTQGAGTRLMHALYPVHAVTVGGAGLVLLAMISAIGLTYLAIGGSYAFLARAAGARASARPRIPGALVHGSQVNESGFVPGADEPGALRVTDT